MKTQDNYTPGTQPASQHPAVRPRGKGWLAGFGAIVVVALVIGISVFVFAQAGQHRGLQASPIPPGGQWQLVLKGYSITSLVTVSSDPANLYACAARMPGGVSQTGPAPVVLLHSTDFGKQWQDIGKTAALSGSCQVTANAANGNEVFIVTSAGNGQTTEILKHSTDGGRTWETIQPTLHSPDGKSAMPWYVQQLRLAGNRLFALQWTLLEGRPYIHQPPYGIISRLITSTDGGHNWQVFDGQLNSTNLGTFDYAIDPSNTSTVYELLGFPWIPPVLKTAGVVDVLPSAIGSNEKLYKTTDNGNTWHMLLDNLPFESQIHVASNKPNVVYAGGSFGPVPLIARPAIQPGQPVYPGAAGPFQMHVSTDSGNTWRDVALPGDLFGLNNWFVSASGQMILSGLYAATGSPTVIPGTVVPVTPVTSTPQASLPTINAGNSQAESQHSHFDRSLNGGRALSSQTSIVAPSPYIRLYDPTTNKWSRLATTPAYGSLIEVTPAATNGGTVLWFMGMNNKEVDLYRYVV